MDNKVSVLGREKALGPPCIEDIFKIRSFDANHGAHPQGECARVGEDILLWREERTGTF